MSAPLSRKLLDVNATLFTALLVLGAALVNGCGTTPADACQEQVRLDYCESEAGDGHTCPSPIPSSYPG